MKKSSLFNISLILVVFCTGLTCRTAAQGIKNEGAAINISSGFMVCQGGLDNASGTINNNGTLGLAGGISNTGTIMGDGNYYVGGSWSNNGTFAAGLSTVIFNGAGGQTITGPYLTTFNNLVIDGTSAGTTIAAGVMVTVSGSTFSPNGRLIIDSDNDYNSGSLIYNGSGTPAGTVTFRRQMRAKDNFGNRHFFSSPAGGLTFSGFITDNSNVSKLWTWQETDGTWQIITSSPGSFESGRGYNLSQTEGSAGMFSFTGPVVTSASVQTTSPYKSDYTPRATAFDYGVGNPDPIWAPGRSWTLYGGGGWNLLGNPYTSAMDVVSFIGTNIDSFDPHYQALYVFDGTTMQYRYAASSVPGYPESGFFSDKIQAGQGFFVLALNNDKWFNFNPNMQVHSTTVPMTKSAVAEEPWPGLQLKVKYNEKENSTLIVYNENMTAGLDPGYDVGQMSSAPDVEIYTTLALKDNSVNFTRQALPVAGADKIAVAVGIDSEKGGEVIFSAFTVTLDNYRFWLEDRTLGIFTNLNDNNYMVTLPAQTYGTGRFFIYASVNTPTGIDEQTGDTEVRIWTSQDKLIIKGSVSQGAMVAVFDLPGNKVLEILLPDEALNTVAMPSGSHGVYLVRVVDGVKIYTQKVVLL